MPGFQNPGYDELRSLAQKLSDAVDIALPEGEPVIVILENDIAKALGSIMKRLLAGKRGVICLDGIKIGQGDYIDLGRPLMDGLVVPVVVKTLLFG